MTENSGVGLNMPPPTSPLAPGYPRPFGKYLLLTPMAQGGMGEVFLATSTSDVAGATRVVVIKTLRADLVAERGYLQRFLDEARIAVQLQHPNIAQVFDVGVVDGTHYIAMEHIAGVTLRRLLDSSGNSVPKQVALAIIIDVLHALDAAHRHRHPLTGEPLHVVHRDISPHNLMLSYDGDVKVIDFGLATSDLKIERTESQVVLGKIAYMSPEQACGEKVAPATDQFAAAVVLYEMLVGERFYGARTQREIWRIVGTGYTPDKLHALDVDLATILRRALDPTPSGRYAACADFAAALHHVLRERFPLADRSQVRDFVREHHDQDRVNTELSLRHAAPVVTAFLSSKHSLVVDTRLAPAGVTPGSDDVASPPSTGATSEHPTAQAQGDDADTEAVLAGRGAARLSWAAGVGGVLIALALGAIVHSISGAEAPQPDAQHVVTAPTAPAMRNAASPSNTPTTAEVEPPWTPPPPPLTMTAMTTTTTRDDLNAKPAPAAKKRGLPPDWPTWPMEQKVRVLESSAASCAKTLLKVRAHGYPLEPGAVDSCVATL